MGGMFASFEAARSGMGVYKLWIDAVADNVANIDNVTSTDEEAFAERFVLVESVAGNGEIGAGARVAAAVFGDPNGIVVHEPNHPLADEEGMVRRPAIDLAEQMVHLQLAQRGYQANLNTFQWAREAYEAALAIGR